MQLRSKEKWNHGEIQQRNLKKQLRNMKTKILTIKVLLLFFSTLHFCSCVEQNESGIEWKVNLKEQADGTYELVCSFKSLTEKKIIFDREAFCYSCTYEEKVKLYDKIMPSPNDFIHSQVVLENLSGNKRLFSNLFTINGESKLIMSDLCMFGCLEYLKVGGDATHISIKIPYLSDLQVTGNDKRIRLIYLFKASPLQIEKGYNDIRIISEWFLLPTAVNNHRN